MALTFDDFELDTERFELRHRGVVRPVEPRVFDLLAQLAREPGRVFTRDELLDSVWKGRIVSDTTVSTCIKNARKALGDSGRQQRFIRTVHRRGIHFAVPVTDGGVARGGAPAAAPPQPGPALLVVPFRPVPDDPQALALAESLSADLATVLTRVPLLRLKVQRSRDEPAAAARAMHESLGVDFVLEGSTRAVTGGFRIRVRLCDARSGFSLWAEHFPLDGALADALESAVAAVLPRLEPRLHKAIYDAVRAAPGDRSAQTLYLEANGILTLHGWHHRSFHDAAELLRRARSLDPGFALAAASLALVMGFGNKIGLMVDPRAAHREALEAAEHALALDSTDSIVLGHAGCALADVGQIERGISLLRNAVEIEPANAQAWAALGAACLQQGDVAQAVAHLRHGVKLSPLDSRLSIWGALLALAHLMAGDMDDALREAELACQRDHRTYIARVVLAAACLAHGNRGRALNAMQAARSIKPDLTRHQVFALTGDGIGRELLALDTRTGAPR